MKPLIRSFCIFCIACMVSTQAFASHSGTPDTVTLVGSLQAELGCPGDWQPDCSVTFLENMGDTLWFGSFAIPAGSYEIKIAINGSWDENYGAGGAQDGPNIPLQVVEDQSVDFYYDHSSHQLHIGEMVAGDLTAANAHWLSADTFAWNVPADAHVSLHYADDAGIVITQENTVAGSESIALTRTSDTVADDLAQRFPHLSGLPVFTLPEDAHDQVSSLLRQQIVLIATDDEHEVVDATGLQIPGVLDDLYGYQGELGPVYNDEGIHARVWAPTARAVKLLVFADSHPETEPVVHAMSRDDETGVWLVSGDAGWDRMYYLYEVEVYVPLTQSIETTISTDPYTVSAAADGRRSQFVNLLDDDLKPEDWDDLIKPAFERIADAMIYEIHVRDFSVHDPLVPEEQRGKFTAFTLEGTHGIEHLKKLVDAGMTHIHLLPVNDCATIPERLEDRVDERDLGLDTHGPASEQQQALIWEIRDQNAFNWCYDPHHFNLPEGSYASHPDGTARIVEFRQMVKALNALGLRVVVDVVYNHTNSAGLGEKSVFDKIVPGYYHRLEDSGGVAMSTCCPGTATEHSMMEKFMIDSIVLWATAYKIDGFRFDLMGHHSRDNMRRVREALDALTEEEHGVNGASILLYGEGWNFGEVANDARFIQATQDNLAGEDIAATFNDRFRDAIRGGSPFDQGVNHVRSQVFVSGLYLNPNDETGDASLQQLLRNKDALRIGLAGSLRDYIITDHQGNSTPGRDIFHHGQAGYARTPLDVINYVEKHDNETLFDINQYKLPLDTSPHDRARVQVLATSLVLLAQGTPFMQAGQELLRSKSMDRNTYNSGDWFNVLDFTHEDNGWGRGMPVANENQASWDEIRPRLENPDLAISSDEIAHTLNATSALLRLRASSPLFRLESAEQVMDVVRFHNTGADQIPGLIVMSLTDVLGLDADHEEIVVIFNADTEAQSFAWSANNNDFVLHPMLAASGDSVLEGAHFDGSFHVPARTTAAFVSSGPADGAENGNGNGGGSDAPRSRGGGSMNGLGVLILLLALGALSGCGSSSSGGSPANGNGGGNGGDNNTILSCDTPAYETAKGLRIYQVMTEAFINGNPAIGHGVSYGTSHHMGDIQGITDSLEYIADLGFNAIWLTPIFDSVPIPGQDWWADRLDATGYYASNYFAIDPRFGTLDEAREMVEKAHELGLYVFFDGVFGHFKQNAHEYPSINGLTVTTEGALRSGVGRQAIYPDDLEFFKEVASYWIEELKIDGWRLDQAYEVPLEGWREIRAAVETASASVTYTNADGETVNPLGYMVAEIWRGAGEITADAYGPEDDPALCSAFDFPVRYSLVQTLAVEESGQRYATATNLNAGLANAHGQYPSHAIPNGFIGNHDLVRFGDLLQRGAIAAPEDAEYWQRHKAAFSFLAAYSGPITFYYGEEIGDEVPGFAEQVIDNCIAEGHCDDHVARSDGKVEGLPSGQAHAVFTANEQQAGLRDYLRNLMHMRATNPALYRGERTQVAVPAAVASQLYAAHKAHDDAAVLYLLNVSGEALEVTFEACAIGSNGGLADLLGDDSISAEAGSYTVQVPALTGRFLSIDEPADGGPGCGAGGISGEGPLAACDLPDAEGDGPLDQTLYIRGTYPGGDAFAATPGHRAFSYKGDNLYQVVVEEVPGSFTFKFASSSWNREYAVAGSAPVILGTEQPMAVAAGPGTESSISLPEAGDYVYSFVIDDDLQEGIMMVSRCAD